MLYRFQDLVLGRDQWKVFNINKFKVIRYDDNREDKIKYKKPIECARNLEVIMTPKRNVKEHYNPRCKRIMALICRDFRKKKLSAMFQL